jgi:ketosteroid isomerase-like protein
MTRAEFEQLLREIYRARLANDLDGCMRCFAPAATFRIAGGESKPVALAGQPPAELRRHIAELVRTWHWKSWDRLSQVIDGNKAAVQYRVTVVHTPSGETLTTEVLDLITAADGKVEEFVQFLDTEKVAAVLARGANRG